MLLAKVCVWKPKTVSSMKECHVAKIYFWSIRFAEKLEPARNELECIIVIHALIPSSSYVPQYIPYIEIETFYANFRAFCLFRNYG